ncbi:hypothetical protein SVAN01_07866 [Stagonosporopsis vannaccii]|nr:hypothetical protein SVAN01_07866 [Stagonosporopsis vannaccii]
MHSQSARELCDCDDLVQALKPRHTRGRSFTNTALGDMQGVSCAPIPELRPGMRAIYPEGHAPVESPPLLPLAPKQRLRVGLETAGRGAALRRSRCTRCCGLAHAAAWCKPGQLAGPWERPPRAMMKQRSHSVLAEITTDPKATGQAP